VVYLSVDHFVTRVTKVRKPPINLTIPSFDKDLVSCLSSTHSQLIFPLSKGVYSLHGLVSRTLKDVPYWLVHKRIFFFVFLGF